MQINKAVDRVLFISLLGLALVFSAACGDASDGGTDAGSAGGSDGGADGGGDGGNTALTPIPVDKFFSRYAAAFCAKAYACCSSKEINTGVVSDIYGNNTSGYASESACTTDITKAMKQDFGWVLDLIPMGDLSYDPKEAANCVEDYLQSSCDQFRVGDLLESPACTKALLEARQLGEVCNDPDLGCVGGWETSYCDMPDTAVVGVCKTMPAHGEACGLGWICAPGDICVSSTGLCQALPKNGEACPDSECVAGAICQRDPNGQPTTCATPSLVAEGQPCDDILLICAEAQFCQAGTTSSVCAPLGTTGAPCTLSSECQSYSCDIAGKCAPPICAG